jgi:hypothetical protein
MQCPHRMYLRIVYGSWNKQRLFPYTEILNGRYNREGECLLRGTS